jgi:hypothetical protein
MCGFELLLLPDARVMGQAIERHALDHKKKHKLTVEQAESLNDYLIAQAFELISKKPKKDYQKSTENWTFNSENI